MIASQHQDGVAAVIPIDGAYLYGFGRAMQPLGTITKDDTYMSAWGKSYKAKDELANFLTQSVFTQAIKLTNEPAVTLVTSINEIGEKAFDSQTGETKLSVFEAHYFSEAFRNFEIVFQAEFRHGNMFLATPKRGYDLSTLINHGSMLFPDELGSKVPESVDDINSATKCIAFELFTASGFHLHRANESVVLKYYDHLSKGKARPENRNMGKYIKELENLNAKPIITSCLRDLKDMHRNPLMHPEESIENMDDAIALLNSIHTCVVAILKELPATAAPVS